MENQRRLIGKNAIVSWLFTNESNLLSVSGDMFIWMNGNYSDFQNLTNNTPFIWQKYEKPDGIIHLERGLSR